MSKLPISLATLTLLAGLATACGGSGGGTPGGPNPPPGDNPPVVTLIAPTTTAAELVGTEVRALVAADDDNGAVLRLLLDLDGDAGTTGDQTVVFQGSDTGGAPQLVEGNLPGALGPGRVWLFASADDGTNAVVTSSGVPVLLYEGIAGVAPPRSNTYGVVQDFVLFSLGEAEQGGQVENGDGLADDAVVGRVDPSTGEWSSLFTSADASTVPPGGLPRLLRPTGAPPRVAWDVREADENMDFNGDGDIVDTTVVVPDPLGGPALVPPQSPDMRLVATLSRSAFHALAVEPNGIADLNLDGDILDTVFHVFDLAGVPIAYAVDTPAPGSPFFSATTAGLNGYFVAEGIQGFGNAPGIDLNADGDTLDTVLTIVDDVGTRLGLAGTVPTLLPPQAPRTVDGTGPVAVSNAAWIGYLVDEAPTSAVPLNGDADTTDFIPALYDITLQREYLPGTALNAGVGSRFFFFEGAVALYLASEEGIIDRNGDGDSLDTEVLHYTDAATAPATTAPVSPGVPMLGGLALDGGSAAHVADGWISAAVTETANRDLNGDGDTSDTILFLIDVRSGTPVVTNTGLTPVPTGAIPGSTIPVTGVGGDDGVVAQFSELSNGNLNGDGDAVDTLLFFFPFANPAARVPLADTGGLHVQNRGGRIAVTASESLTSRDFDGDGSTLGFVLRVFDATGQVLEPGRTSASISVPAADDGTRWVWLRSEIAEGRDLNGDGDQVDVVLGIWSN